MVKTNTITFEVGCNKYLDDCRQRNLREGTLRHYRQSYTQFYNFFDPQMPLSKLNESMYKKAILVLC